MAQVKPKGKTKILSLLLELEDNRGLWAGAEESLHGIGHDKRTIELAMRFEYIEIWRTCDDTTYYQLTVKGKRKTAREYWCPLELRDQSEYEKSIRRKSVQKARGAAA